MGKKFEVTPIVQSAFDAYDVAYAALKTAEQVVREELRIASPVQVGDVIRFTGTDGDEPEQILKIEHVGIDTYNFNHENSHILRYQVRKKTKNGWHKTIMIVSGLSSQIRKGNFEFIEVTD